ncbi:SET domain-containing protein [Lentithecium fluviatile CBS 122367]|uniref:SET domain-containing protein n=1 Tax=Lentithecium fluviatile CBS 122367 TaxID=1168545 RepID=A0A6G1ILA3_9PLEO|nr:SET domain-containing protein [Lentithecium fluviatile CBS 122367]
MLAAIPFAVVSLLSTAHATQHSCITPIPSSPYTSGIPSWLSEDFSCTGSPQVWEARPSPGKGMGVFATKTLEPGDIILQETPVIRIHPPQFRDGVAYPLGDIETLIRRAFDALSDVDKADVLSLYAHTTSNEDIDELVAIFRSNAYIIGSDNSDLGLFPKGARINHSCRPNTSQVWHEKTGKRVVRAIKRIEEGEEMFATYIPLLHSHDVRQKRLRQYGFQCTCEACVQQRSAQEASDKRRNDIRNAFAAFEPQLTLSIPKSVAGRKKAQKNANASLELAELVEEEGLADYYAQAYRIAAISHARIEKWEPATLWAHKAYQLRLVENRESPATLELQALTGRFIEMWNEDLRNESMGQR